jgi:hypothetical protein
VQRLKIWWEIARPTWRWIVLIPLTILSSLATIRDELIESKNPILHLVHWLPAWPAWLYTVIAVAAVTLGRVDGFDQDEAQYQSDERAVIASSLLAS